MNVFGACPGEISINENSSFRLSTPPELEFSSMVSVSFPTQLVLVVSPVLAT
jgi:hypothetical protein